MTVHRLDPLLRPDSIAVVGASRRPATPGNEVLVNLQQGAFTGRLYPVNPGYDSIADLPCYASLSALPEVPQHVIFTVSDDRIEALFDEAIALGVSACTIFSALQLPADTQPNLQQRIQLKAQRSGMLLHGANCMGFLNFRDGVWASGFDTRSHRPGNVSLLSQSGAGMSGIMDCEQRLDFNFAASTGQELTISMEDYLDFVLDLPETRVVGLFLETSRHPVKFIEALEKARRRQIPIVAVKVGKTALAAKLAISHSGALAGSDASYQAVFDRYGVQRVDDMAQLATALIMFAQPNPVGSGGLVTLHDSGGERQLAIDLAQQLAVSLVDLAEPTVSALEKILDPGLPALNPLDAWGGGGAGAGKVMEQCFTLLMQDSGTALGAVVHDRAPEGKIYPAYLEYLRAANKATGKPVFLVANHQGSGADAQVCMASREGLSVIDGLREFLCGAKCLMAYRAFMDRVPGELPVLENARLSHWRDILSGVEVVSEAQAGELLRDFGIPIVTAANLGSRADLERLATELQYPVVLKTASPGIAHKSDAGGVVLNLANAEVLFGAYDDMACRLGPDALVAPMVNDEGLEMILGVARDAQFGPTVVLGIGGIYTEVLQDFAVLLPPFAPEVAVEALNGLKLRPILDEVRGRPALNVLSFCEAASRLSVLALALSDCVEEIDINPMKLTATGCIGLDALITTVTPLKARL